MTARESFRATMAERRHYKRGTLDHDYLTRAARQYVWLMRGVPTTEWQPLPPPLDAIRADMKDSRGSQDSKRIGDRPKPS